MRWIAPLTLVAIAGCNDAPFVELPEAKERMVVAAPIAEAAELHKERHGSYPDSLETVPVESSVKKQAELKGVSYTVLDRGNGYAVSFNFSAPPFNPQCVYGRVETQNKQPTWQCTGK